MQMAEFVKSKSKDGTFENGRAFYEFTRHEEDLDSFKDVVLMMKKEVSTEFLPLNIFCYIVARVDLHTCALPNPR